MTKQTSQRTNQTHKHAHMRTMGVEVDIEDGWDAGLSLNFVCLFCLFVFVLVA
jgi:hypothetical protein